MSNKPLISIAIPTYNRANFLKNLLDNILPQASCLGGEVEICISNNCSTDNTREVVMGYKEKYPNLINYNENEKNLGMDRNILKAMEMPQGDFVWLLGDDDMVVSNGIKKAVDFINNYCNKNTGLITFGHEARFVDNKTGKEVVWFHTIEKNKPKIYKIDRKNVVESCFPDSTFISVLLFNNIFLKKILKEEKIIIDQALKAKDYIHVFLYQLMFLKYSQLEAIRLNEKIIDEDLHYYKLYVEDRFQLHYVAPRRLTDLLLSSKYMDDYYRKIFVEGKKSAKSVIIEIGILKCFKSFNYSSFFGCIKMFFQQATFKDALLFSASFIIFSAIPSVILRNLYKIFLKVRFKKEWQKVWLSMVISNSEMARGTRRFTD